MKRGLAALALLAVLLGPADAVEPDEILSDPALEARAREISKEVRCLVCQNEAIDSSNADLARDLRLLVRERLLAGDSDEEVKAFLVARYGDFVLLSPPMRRGTLLLWFGPGILLLSGMAIVILYYRRARRRAAAQTSRLDPEEEARLAALETREDKAEPS